MAVSLSDHRIFFDRMLSLIPSTYYRPQDTLPDEIHVRRRRHVTAPKHKLVKRKYDGKKKKGDLSDGSSLQQQGKNSSTDDRDDELRGLSASEAVAKLREKLQTRVRDLQPKRKDRSQVPPEKRRKKASDYDNKAPPKKKKKKEKKVVVESPPPPSSLPKKSSDDNKVPKSVPSEYPSSKVPDLMFSNMTVDGEDGGQDSQPGVSKKELLRRATAFQKKVERLKGIDKEKAEKILEDKAVSNALLRAQGVKVKDDPKLLKKTLKRKQKSKAKSTAEWKERKASLEREAAERQEKRNHNLATRMTKKRKKNLKT